MEKSKGIFFFLLIGDTVKRGTEGGATIYKNYKIVSGDLGSTICPGGQIQNGFWTVLDIIQISKKD